MVITRKKLVLTILITPILLILGFELIFWNKPYPNVHIGQESFSNKAQMQLALKKRETQNLTLQISNSEIKSITINPNLLAYDIEQSWRNAVSYGRNDNPLANFQTRIKLLFTPTSLNPVYDFDELTFDTILADMLRPYEKEPLESQIRYENGQVTATFSRAGQKANRQEILEQIKQNLNLQTTTTSFNITIQKIDPQITPENSQSAILKTRTALSRPIILSTSDNLYQKTLDSNQIFELLQYQFNPTTKSLDVEVANYKLALLLADIPTQLNQDPIEGKKEQVGSILIITEDPKPGQKVDLEQLTQQVSEKLFNNQLSSTIEIPLEKIEPALTKATVNQYGIKERIAQGISYFRGSSPARIQNIRIATQKLNGALISPNTTFSMYAQVGDIERRTGFTDSIIIKNGRTISGIGGGVCQVSTTLYRAALWAGLPIVERRPHSFRVSYYEQESAPGLDAAIYFPDQDLKFYNDTGKHIVIQSILEEDQQKLTLSFWGVNDGRKVSLSDPVITDRRPPPPEVRLYSSDVPQGTIRQTDFAIDGAQVDLTRTIEKNSQINTETISSIYRPWQAVYLVGTKQN